MVRQKNRAGGKLSAALCALIPQKVGNRTVLWAMEVMRKLSRVPEDVIAGNHAQNMRTLSEGSIFEPREMIENQACWEKIRFGCGRHHSMQYSGCEIIAAYNALLALSEAGSVARMAGLISRFERNGSLRRGEFGCSPCALRDFFLEKGYEVRMTATKDWETIERIGRESDVLIVTAYNDRKNIMAQVHTVCITKESGGGYAVHNAYCWDKDRYAAQKKLPGGYESLREAIAAIHEGAAPIAVLGVSGSQDLER